jgi:transglutaminase-like putative cysteine protease
MALPVALLHRTCYRYDRPVMLGPQIVRLRPAPHTRPPVLSYALTVTPDPGSLHWYRDPQGNLLAKIIFPEPVDRFDLAVELSVDMTAGNPFDFVLEPESAVWPIRYPAWLAEELAPLRAVGAADGSLTDLLLELPRETQPAIDMLVGLNRLVQSRIAYTMRMDPGVQTPSETLDRRLGSCRDSAWLLVELLRRLGYAARFVSGYLIQLADDTKKQDGENRDRADLHAWAEVYLDGAGWIGFDATSGLMTGEGHIPLAAGVTPARAAPVSGNVEKNEAAFEVETSVVRLAADLSDGGPAMLPVTGR